MINIFLLCEDLKKPQSTTRKSSNSIICKIYSFLNNPSEKTAVDINSWEMDFKYIYGEVDTNLSSNNKLDTETLFERYNILYENSDDEPNQTLLLFLAIQTFFSLLIKSLMKEILEPNGMVDSKSIINGGFFEKNGIKNYCEIDALCWPQNELENGFEIVMEDINNMLSTYTINMSVDEFVRENNYDFIKQMYEAIIPKEIRHALGEYYTPDWLAEQTIKEAFHLHGTDDIKKIKIIDPTCGSGTFLFKSIIEKRRAGASLNEILDTVCGFDINTLAILTAKTNYLLSIYDLCNQNESIELPLYKVDIINSAKCSREEEQISLFEETDTQVSEEEFRTIKSDKRIIESVGKADIIVGNPPWVNWEYMPENYRKSSQKLWVDYGLFSASGRDLSFSKEDISVLITYIVIDKLLTSGGVIGFVIRQGVFKSAQNGVGFRNFGVKDQFAIKVVNVDDLSKIKAFDNATNSTAILYAKKGAHTLYPVSYRIWTKRHDVKRLSFNTYSELKEVLSQIDINEQAAMPSIEDDKTSPWVTAPKEDLHRIKKVLGKNCYKARTGVFTGGANAVYWLNIIDKKGEDILVTNIVERAKRKAEKITATIEKTYVFPMLKGSNLKKWNITYDSYILCPHTVETKMWPVSHKILQNESPATYAYLSHFKNNLNGRKGFAGWEKEIQAQEFHSILRIGEYTFSKYKVAWRYIASEFICSVISTVDDMYLGDTIILPNEKIMYVSTDNEKEAYYLCGVLSSNIVAKCIESYMNPTSISAHVLDKLEIPKYDPDNDFHNKIADICKDGHGKENVDDYISQIDLLITEIYDL